MFRNQPGLRRRRPIELAAVENGGFVPDLITESPARCG